MFLFLARKSAEYKEKAVGSAVMLDCRRNADKQLFYSHSKTQNAVSVADAPGRVVSDKENGLYTLLNLKLDDTGFYYCGKSKLLMHLVVRGTLACIHFN
jgi:hypothetical protein